MKRIAALALVGAALLSRAATTNEGDVAALLAAVDAGLSETNGWTLSGLVKYAKGADYSSNIACVKFDTKGDWLESKDFGARIIGVELVVRCSATDSATRLLHFRDMAGADAGVVATCSQANRCESKSLAFPGNTDLSQFRIVLDGSGNTGVWGLGEMFVVTADPVYAPGDLGVSKKGDDWCALSWSNGEGTVSNRVDTTLVERSEEGETVLFSTGFDSFSAAGNPEPKTNELAKIDAALSGLRIYSPANTTGVCQIAIGTASGYLRHSGFADYSGISLKLVLKQYPGDNAGTQIAYEIGDEIKVFGDKIPLPEEFEERIVDLNDIPDGAAILIGYDTVPSKRRVLVDSLEFVRKGVETKTLVDSRWLPASPGAASFSTKGVLALPARAECRFEVRAQNADGIVSDAAGVETKLGGTPGARLILR